MRITGHYLVETRKILYTACYTSKFIFLRSLTIKISKVTLILISKYY